MKSSLHTMFNQLFEPVQAASQERISRAERIMAHVKENAEVDTEGNNLRRFLKQVQDEINTVDCEIINGRPRAKLSRDQADTIVDLVNVGRSIAQDSDKWTQAHLDIWDNYWNGTATSNGIEHTLTNYHNPNMTLKQLLWCVNSITKTQTSKAVPKFVKTAVRELRRMEKEGE